MEKKQQFKDWVNQHKVELIGAGVVVVVGTILVVKNWDKIIMLFSKSKTYLAASPKLNFSGTSNSLPIESPELLESIDNIAKPQSKRLNPQVPFDVDSHVRNLPEGWCASPEKIATAEKHGYVLHPGQTWVEKYTKGQRVA